MSTQFTIEKNIPLPSVRRGNSLARALGSMEVGDSFAFTTEKPKNVHSTLRHAAKRAGIKLTIRSIEGSFRAWRVE